MSTEAKVRLVWQISRFFGLKGTTKRNGALAFSHMTNALTDSFPTLELQNWEQCRFADLFNTDVLGTYFFDYSPLEQHKIFSTNVKYHIHEKIRSWNEHVFGAKFIDTLTSYHKTISNLSAPNEMNFRSFFVCLFSFLDYLNAQFGPADKYPKKRTNTFKSISIRTTKLSLSIYYLHKQRL